MEHHQVAAWLRSFGRAWERRDIALAGSLFTPDARYQDSPFTEPLIGRESIITHWAAIPENQEEIHFQYTVLGCTADVGFAEWKASFIHKANRQAYQISGIVSLELDAKGLCRNLREWWYRKQTR